MLPEGIHTASFLTEKERAFACKLVAFFLRNTVWPCYQWGGSEWMTQLFLSPALRPLPRRLNWPKGSKAVTCRLNAWMYQSWRPSSKNQKKRNLNGGRSSEVSRSLHYVMKVSSKYAGIVDIQTWLTGFAYFGLIVSLYSYSLFLYVFSIFSLPMATADHSLKALPSCLVSVTLVPLLSFIQARQDHQSRYLGEKTYSIFLYSTPIRSCSCSHRCVSGVPNMLYCVEPDLEVCSRGRYLERSAEMARSFHLDMSSLGNHRYDSLSFDSCGCLYWSPHIGYILAITAENNTTRYVAVFFMAAGV